MNKESFLDHKGLLDHTEIDHYVVALFLSKSYWHKGNEYIIEIFDQSERDIRNVTQESAHLNTIIQRFNLAVNLLHQGLTPEKIEIVFQKMFATRAVED